MIAFFNGKFLEKEQIAISPDDRGFLFADGVYEVIRSYDGKLFQVGAHLERLDYGLKQLQIAGIDVAQLGQVATRLVEENRLVEGDATIYLQITRGSAPRAHHFPPAGTSPTVYAFARAFHLDAEARERGAKAILVTDHRWARCHIKTTALVANILANQQAREAGALEALFVRDAMILEGSHTNVFFAKNGTLMTAPLSNYILPGVTRKIILDLASSLSIPIVERSVLETELAEMSEAFLVSTTLEVAPIVQIEDRPVGSGEPGRIAARLLDSFQRMTR